MAQPHLDAEGGYVGGDPHGHGASIGGRSCDSGLQAGALEMSLPNRQQSSLEFYTPWHSTSRPDVLVGLGLTKEQPTGEGGMPALRAPELLRHRRTWSRKRWWSQWPLACTAKVLAIFSGVVLVIYLIVPQLMIQHRLSQAEVEIKECVLEAGGVDEESSAIRVALDLAVPPAVLRLPFVSFSAAVYGFSDSRVFFITDEKLERPVRHLLGHFSSKDTMTMRSWEDEPRLQVGGKMIVSDRDILRVMVNDFVKEDSVTMGMEAKVDIYARVWGWLPVPFYSIMISKSLSIPAFNGFRDHPIKLKEIEKVEANRELMKVTGTALIFNPTPVTMLMKDSLRLEVFYPVDDPMFVAGMTAPPGMRVAPGWNVNTAVVRLLRQKNETRAENLQKLLREYIGDHEGFRLAGEHGNEIPLLVGGVTTRQKMLREAVRDLSLAVGLVPLPIKFLTAVTADVVMLGSMTGYTVTAHLLITNPLPETVRVRNVDMVAHYDDLAGPVLYKYTRAITPSHDDDCYTLGPRETAPVNFELNPAFEVYYNALGSLSTISGLASQAFHKSIAMGVRLNLTLTIGDPVDGFAQEVRYSNNRLSGELCLSLSPPSELCGEMMKKERPPAEAGAEEPTLSSDSDSDDRSEDHALDPIFWSERRLL